MFEGKPDNLAIIGDIILNMYIVYIYIYTYMYKYIYITFNIDNIDISINSG